MYADLFLSFMQIGVMSIGGGYAALPIIEDIVVTQNAWITLSEFADIITIAEMTPGPIAINAATFVGTKVLGLSGAIIATLGFITPCFIIAIVLSVLYSKYSQMGIVKKVLIGVRPAVASFIASAGITIMSLSFLDSSYSFGINYHSIIIFTICSILIFKKHLSPMIIIMLSGALGIVLYSF